MRTEPCLDPDRVEAYLSGRLSAGDRRAVERHVAGCSPCRELLSALVRSAGSCWGLAGADEGLSSSDATTLPVADAEVDAQLQIGASIGRYVVVGLLGAGGMGVVYAAQDRGLHRKVALKLLRSDATAESEADSLRQWLHREAQAMAQLAHPNVVTVYDVGTFGKRIFIAMELIGGQTLAQWLALERRRPLREVLGVFIAAGQGLAAAHAAGLVHRDFKPENVLIGNDGRVRVSDFGLACRAAEASTPAARGNGGGSVDATARRPSLTRTGSLVGTPYYMAPEQFRGERSDARSDQFSFCVALCCALTGRHPYLGEGDTDDELVAAVVEGRLRPLMRDRRLPQWLARVLTRGLAADPDARYPSLAELLGALAGDATPRRNRAVAAGLAAVAVAVAFAWRAHERRVVCADAARKLGGVWDRARADRIQRAFAATGNPFAAVAFAEAERVLGAYTHDWVAMHVDACEATHVRGEQSPELLDLRMMCLDARLRDVRALTDQLATANADLVTRAPGAVHRLDDLAGCAHAQALRSIVRPPADQAKRARVEALRGELAEVKALERAGRYGDGVTRARALAVAVTDAGYRPLEAEVLLELGTLEYDLSSPNATVEKALQQAVWAAEASRYDELAAQALLKLMFFYDTRGHGFNRSLRLQPRVTAALERLGGNVELEAKLHTELGRNDHGQSRYVEAEAALGRAEALLKHRFGPNDIRLIEVYVILGDVELASGAPTRALADYEHARNLARTGNVYIGPDAADVEAKIAQAQHPFGRRGARETAAP